MKPSRLIFPSLCLLILLAFIALPLVSIAMMQPRTIVVAAGADVQAAVSSSQPGDKIIVEAGAVFPKSLFLPNRPGNFYTTIQTSKLAQLPLGRVSPADVVNMPKITSDGSSPFGSSNQPVIGTHSGAHHWKLVGLEITTEPGNTVNSIVQLEGQGQGPGNTAPVPHHIILDRCVIHPNGPDDRSPVRGIALNTGEAEVTNSYIYDIHGTRTDSQAIFAWNALGPFKILNNYLEATSENLQIGYGDLSLTPNDMEIRGNTLAKPMAWRSPELRGKYNNIKNHFEIKGGTNIRFIGNTLDGNWADGQSGHSIVITGWANRIADVLVRDNAIRRVGAGVTIFGAERVTVANNLFTDINASTYNNPHNGANAAGHFVALGNGAKDVTIDHNTNPDGAHVSVDGNNFAVAPNFRYTNNIAGTVNGSDQIASLFQNGGEMKANVRPWFQGGHGGTEDVYGFNNYSPTGRIPQFPQVTLYPSLNGAVFWFTFDRSQVGLDSTYRLLPNSIYKGKGTDAKDIGADIDALEAALGGVTPLPTPSPSPSPTPTPVPTPAVIKPPVKPCGVGDVCYWVWESAQDKRTAAIKNAIAYGCDANGPWIQTGSYLYCVRTR